MALITMAQVKAQLLIDHDNDDAKLAEIAAEASHVMTNYLKKSDTFWNESTVPLTVKSATLKVAAALYMNRDGASVPALSQDVMDMVHRYRDPALA